MNSLKAEKVSCICAIMYMCDILRCKWDFLSTIDYRLVIICSNEEEEKSHIISKLHTHRRPFAQIYDTDQCQRYLKTHFTGEVESLSSSPSQMQLVTASEVDYEKYVHEIFFFSFHKLHFSLTCLHIILVVTNNIFSNSTHVTVARV